MDVEGYAKIAHDNIQNHTDSGLLHAELAGQEMVMECERVELKAKLIDALIGTDNAATKRPHSADSAEKAANADPRYLAHVKALSDVVVRKNKARTLRGSANLRARLATAMVKAESRALKAVGV